MKKVYIMSGVSGSGKSTAVQALLHEHINSHEHTSAVVVSADHFFGKDTKEYKKNFSPHLLGDAHSYCKLAFLKEIQFPAIKSESSAVFVDNTNTTALEMAFYIEAALAYDCEVIVVRVLADVEACVSRNTHGVPEHAVRAMHERFENNTPANWPYHWQELEVRTIDNRAQTSK